MTLRILFLLVCLASFGLAPVSGESKADGDRPTDPKAQKIFHEAEQWQKERNKPAAIGGYLKANGQDGGHCEECLTRAYTLALQIEDFKRAEEASRAMLAVAASAEARAAAHYRLGIVLQREGVGGKKEKFFMDSCEELKAALEQAPSFPSAHYAMGISLAYLHQDEAARKEFSAFVSTDKSDAAVRERAARYVDHVELARARMAPAFALTTTDGHSLSMDSLAGKVVLIDFWATWCGPCRQALPRIQKIAQKFQGQPLVVLSVSLDEDESKWREFVGKNHMSWLQYRDGGFDGAVATRFGVRAIPATFTIDADGVLEDQHVGDAEIEDKLKKLVARAVEAKSSKERATGQAAGQPAGAS